MNTQRYLLVGLSAAVLSLGCSGESPETEPLGRLRQELNVCNETVPDEHYVDGIPAYAQCSETTGAIWSNNGVDTSTTSEGADWVRTQYSGGYQCTEYAYRYLYFHWGIDYRGGNGGEWCDGNLPDTLVANTTGVHGDLIVFAPGSCGADMVYGHIAVVDSIDEAQGRVTFVEQNGANRRSCPIDTANCFLHAVANDGQTGAGGAGGEGGAGGASVTPGVGGSPSGGAPPLGSGGASVTPGVGGSPSSGASPVGSGGASVPAGVGGSPSGGAPPVGSGGASVTPGVGGSPSGGSPPVGSGGASVPVGLGGAASGGSPPVGSGGASIPAGLGGAPSGGAAMVGSGGDAVVGVGGIDANLGTGGTQSGGAPSTGGLSASAGPDVTLQSSDEEESGCGCFVAGSKQRTASPLGLAVAALLVLRRRRLRDAR